ncbi:hypothetical protein [Diaphorobacter nitroreducens]
MRAYALKSGKKTIEVSRRESYLWRLAVTHVYGRAEWTVGCVTHQDKGRLRARGFDVLPIDFTEVK